MTPPDPPQPTQPSDADGAGASSRGGGIPRLGVFVSGTGRTLRNLEAWIAAGRLRAELALVLASGECPAADWARERGLAVQIRAGVIPVDELEGLRARHGLDCIVLAGYLRLLAIPESLRGRVVNVHPALLPSFGGKGMYGLKVHRAVLEAGCKVSGCTVHLCDDRYDTGPILAQAACVVEDDDTPETLAARVFALELELYPMVIGRLLGGGYVIDGRRARAVGAAE